MPNDCAARRCGRPRWLAFYAALLGAVLSYGQEREGVIDALRLRYSQFNRVRAEFDWLQCRASLKDDPFDPRNWHLDPGSSIRYKCSMWIVRPDFRFGLSGPLPGERDIDRSWIDGKRTDRQLDPDGTWSVYIDDNRWAIHGVIPYLTPFEMQLCDVQVGLLEMMEAGGLHVERYTDEQVVLAGYPTAEPAVCEWNVRAVLDPQRGLLPLELRADIDFKNRKHIYWTVKTLDSVPLGDIHIMSEAIFALDSSTGSKRWQIYHYKLTDVTRDDSLDKRKLAIRIPKKNTKFMDATRGYIRHTDGRGRVTYEKQMTPEEMAEREQMLEAARRQEVLRYEQGVRRRRAFYGIVAGSVVVVLAVAGLWLWRHWSRR